MALLVLTFVFDYVLGRFTGIDANREFAEKILFQDVSVKRQLGDIQSHHERKQIAYGGVPGTEPKYLEYGYTVKGKLDTATVQVRLFFKENGSMSHHSVEIGQ